MLRLFHLFPMLRLLRYNENRDRMKRSRGEILGFFLGVSFTGFFDVALNEFFNLRCGDIAVLFAGGTEGFQDFRSQIQRKTDISPPVILRLAFVFGFGHGGHLFLNVVTAAQMAHRSAAARSHIPNVSNVYQPVAINAAVRAIKTVDFFIRPWYTKDERYWGTFPSPFPFRITAFSCALAAYGRRFLFCPYAGCVSM